MASLRLDASRDRQRACFDSDAGSLEDHGEHAIGEFDLQGTLLVTLDRCDGLAVGAAECDRSGPGFIRIDLSTER